MTNFTGGIRAPPGPGQEGPRDCTGLNGSATNLNLVTDLLNTAKRGKLKGPSIEPIRHQNTGSIDELTWLYMKRYSQQINGRTDKRKERRKEGVDLQLTAAASITIPPQHLRRGFQTGC